MSSTNNIRPVENQSEIRMTVTDTKTEKISHNPQVEKESAGSNTNMIFSKFNIIMMLGCLAMIIIGFLLMSGGSSTIEGGFNPDIFSTRRIVVGPTIAFLGFLLMAFAIIIPFGKRNKKSNTPNQ